MADNNKKIPVPFIRPQYFDANGAPLSLGKLYTYEAGGLVAKTTYTTAAGDVQNDNPIILDSAGRPAKNGAGVGIYLSPAPYRLILKDAAGTTIWDEDNVWMPSGVYTPTLINVLNVAASVAYPAFYTRVGDVVSVNGKVSVDPTAGGGLTTLINMSVPIPSAMIADDDLSGIATSETALQTTTGWCYSDFGSDSANFVFYAQTANNTTWRYQYSYRIR